jgi:hypothetical protein
MTKAAELTEQLTALEGRVTLLEGAIKALSAKPKNNGYGNGKVKVPTSVNVEPADDSDLDSTYGDPRVLYDPHKWDGPTGVGLLFSQQSAEYLRAMSYGLAQRGQWLRANRSDDASMKKAYYAEKDAGRALGWALRVEAGNGRGVEMTTETVDGFADMVDEGQPF